MTVVIGYTEADVAEAVAAGDARHNFARTTNLEHFGGRRLAPDFARENDHVGAIGEWACAVYFGLQFNPSVGELNTCDLGIIEVRARRRGPNTDLAWRAHDAEKARKPFVQTIVDLEGRTAEIVGWLCGWEIKERAEGRPEHYGVRYVPPPYHSVRSLEQWIACGHREHWHPTPENPKCYGE